MPPPTPLTPAERFALTIDGLCRAIAARGREVGLAGGLALLLWSWLRRTARRFDRLAARVAAGTKPRATKVRRRPAAKRPPTPWRLPRGRAWLVRLVGWEAAGYGSQLRHLLADPDMAALLEAAPQARRYLNPLCRMLGIAPPPGRATPPPAPPPANAPDATRHGEPPAATLPCSKTAPPPLPARHACGPPVPA